MGSAVSGFLGRWLADICFWSESSQLRHGHKFTLTNDAAEERAEDGKSFCRERVVGEIVERDVTRKKDIISTRRFEGREAVKALGLQ